MCFCYWWGVCVNVKSMFAYWFCEAGVFINLVVLVILTYWPICQLFLCKVDSWLVKKITIAFYGGILNFPQGRILSACIYCKGSLFVFLREFLRFLWLFWRMQEAEEEASRLFEGGTSRGWNERGIWDLMAEVLKLAQTLQYLAAKFTTWATWKHRKMEDDTLCCLHVNLSPVVRLCDVTV